jgi:dihydroxyacetone kinase-like predicted kinase
MSEEFKTGSSDIKTIVTVPSKEIMNLFTEKLGVHLCINTSGTGAPSVDTFYQAIKKVDSSKVILILDDSNYYLSARQAIDLLPTNVKCEVYNARSIVTSEFLCSLINYSLTFSANKKAL